MDTSRRIGDVLFPDSSDRQLQSHNNSIFHRARAILVFDNLGRYSLARRVTRLLGCAGWLFYSLDCSDHSWIEFLQLSWSVRSPKQVLAYTLFLKCVDKSQSRHIHNLVWSHLEPVITLCDKLSPTAWKLSTSQRLLRSLEAAEYTLLSLSEFMDNSSDNLVVLCVMRTRCGGVMWKHNGIDSDNWADCSSSAAPNLQIQLALLMLSHRSETTINQHYRIYPSTETGHHIHAFRQQNSSSSRIEQWDRQNWEQPQHTNADVGWSDHNDSPDETLCC